MRNIRGFTVIIGIIFLVGMLYYSTGVLWPEQIQALYSTNYTIIGLYAMAFGLAGAIFAPIAGWLMVRTDGARWLLTGLFF